MDRIFGTAATNTMAKRENVGGWKNQGRDFPGRYQRSKRRRKRKNKVMAAQGKQFSPVMASCLLCKSDIIKTPSTRQSGKGWKKIHHAKGCLLVNSWDKSSLTIQEVRTASVSEQQSRSGKMGLSKHDPADGQGFRVFKRKKQDGWSASRMPVKWVTI